MVFKISWCLLFAEKNLWYIVPYTATVPLAFFCSFKTVFFFFYDLPFFLLFIIQSTGWEVGNVLVS